MPTYDKFVFDEIRRIGQAWFDKNPQDWMANLTDDNKKFLFEKIGEMSWRRLVDNKSMKTIFEEIGVNPQDYGEVDIEIPPVDSSTLITYPRYGMSIAGLLVGTKHDIKETLKRFVDAGANSTRINLLSALWNGVDCLPFNREPNGLWNLYFWNDQYFERLQEIKESFNSAGINIQWTNYELYSWSKRKQGVQQNNTPWRNNVNGVNWSQEDDTLYILPDEWSKEWFRKVCPLLDLEINPFEIGNELPEKGLHERVRDEVKKIIPRALIQVNRNDDTPGQYKNMKIGINYDFVSFHGSKLKQLSDLNRKDYQDGPHDSWQDFIDDGPHKPNRVIFSSDGARINKDSSLGITETYDWVRLGEFFDHMSELGYNIEHQSRAKMTPAPNHHMIEVDWFKERVKK